MKLALMFVSLFFASVGFAEAANPFAVKPLPTPDAPALDEPLPKSYMENKTVFDALEIVARSNATAVLRYPMPGSSANSTAQGVSYRQVVVQHGRPVFFGGRSFTVVLPKRQTTVQFIEQATKKIFWEGDLSAPKVFYAAPNQADFQYAPPLSAGVGVGQSQVHTPLTSGAPTR